MRRARLGGLCALCGTESVEGLYWENDLGVLDLGNGVILEADTTCPVLCDSCDILHRVVEAYRDAAWGQRVYCAANVRDALRLLGWQPTAELRRVMEARRGVV